jgi:RimJ/RimL family protein N-acetyltransferase
MRQDRRQISPKRPIVTVLTTLRLTLSPVAVADFDDLKRLWGDDDFTRYVMGRSLGAEEVWFRLLRDIGHWTALGHGNWSMRLTETGAYVGTVGVLDYRRDLDPPFEAPELGWGIGGEHQGKGLAREGLDAALAWADERHARTVCMIGPENAASFKLAERVGYRVYQEGRYKDAPITLLERFAPDR